MDIDDQPSDGRRNTCRFALGRCFRPFSSSLKSTESTEALVVQRKGKTEV
uniref:Uncharacterized protein n=1 Tax=Arundo donax TaxID=35708 RepID=A0A0A8ZNI9_ARUDO